MVARKAEEVTVHTTMTAMNIGAPALAIKGISKNAAQESAVVAVTNTPSRPSTRVTRSAAIPVAKSQIVKTA